ncbi:MAG: transcription termination factor Rho [Clostridiales bacterium]|nr:transcription termination factor Rho [Clostridiales bacterium]
MDLADSIRLRLDTKGIHQLWQIGRAVGVANPTKRKKAEIIDDILAIAKNRTEPCPRPTRGAPPKSEEYDFETVEEILKCKQYYAQLASSAEEPPEKGVLTLSSVEEEEEATYSGVLEPTEKFWFLRTQNMQITSANDVFMHISFVNRFRLRTGDKIVCRAKRRKPNECPGATYILSVNGRSPDTPRGIPFESLTPCYPDRRITLENPDGNLTDRVIDLFSPIGFGQRALIVSPPKAGKTTMLKNIACGIRRNHPDALVIVLLVDERPEEVTDIMRSVDGAEVIYSTFDKGDVHHTHIAGLTLEYAKRQAETGRDVVLLLDSITRLARAHNALANSGRTLSGGLDPQALVEPKRFFGAARNIENGGSLTIIATALVDTGSRLDDIIYEEFKSTGNMEIVLSRQLAERRVFPAIDIRSSGARKEELLLNENELGCAAVIRGQLAKNLKEEELYASMKKAATNGEFCVKSQAFLKVFKS